jgi:hypothetical protein
MGIGNSDVLNLRTTVEGPTILSSTLGVIFCFLLRMAIFCISTRNRVFPEKLIVLYQASKFPLRNKHVP